jgi:hypothetical protein
MQHGDRPALSRVLDSSMAVRMAEARLSGVGASGGTSTPALTPCALAIGVNCSSPTTSPDWTNKTKGL